MHPLSFAALFTLGDTLGAAVPALLQYVLAPTIPLIGGGIVWCLVHLGLWLRAKGQTSKVALALASIVDFVSNASKTVIDGLAPDIKEALANDGVIDARERGVLLEKTFSLVQSTLPSWLQSVLTSSFGAAASTWLRGQVSKALDVHLDDIASDHGGHSIVPPSDTSKLGSLPTDPIPLERPTRP